MNTATLDRPAIEPTTALTEQAKSEVGALALITLDPARYVAEVFQPYRAKMAALVEASDAAKRACPDLRTAAGMDIAIKHRAGFRDEIRISGEKTRVERKAPLLTIGKLLDSEYKEVAAEALPHETYWDAGIKAEESRKESEKAAKIKAERERTEAIQARIAKIIAIPADVAGMQSSYISDEFAALSDLEIDGSFDTFRAAAEAAKVDALARLQVMFDKANHAEATAREAERARIAEAERMAAEKAENARIRAENDRIAAEQAVEAKRLTDLAAATERNLQVERDAQAELVRIERERVAGLEARAAAVLKAKQDYLDARIAAYEATVKLDADHAEALAMNTEFDIDAAADLARCTETAQAMLTNGRSQDMSLTELADSIGDGDPDSAEPTDIEIIDVYVENFGGTRPQAVARLLAFVGDEAAA